MGMPNVSVVPETGEIDKGAVAEVTVSLAYPQEGVVVTATITRQGTGEVVTATCPINFVSDAGRDNVAVSDTGGHTWTLVNNNAEQTEFTFTATLD